MIRASDPKDIHCLASSPPITPPCCYGMDCPDPEELIANRYNGDIKAMAEAIGVDSLRYLSADGLVKAVQESNDSEHEYCTACFTGNYPVPVHYDVAEKKASSGMMDVEEPFEEKGFKEKVDVEKFGTGEKVGSRD